MALISVLNTYAIQFILCVSINAFVKAKFYHPSGQMEDADFSENFYLLNENGADEHAKPLEDDLNEDDSEEFDLADIIALSTSSVYKDSDKYTDFEKLDFVDLHNIYRSNLTVPIPKASDMQYVEWNNTLAWAAGDHLQKCELQRGWGDKDNMTDKQNQNMYKGSSMHPSRPMWLWYREYVWFFFNNKSCSRGYPNIRCDHFTQIVWHNSKHIGCARKSNCFPLESKNVLVSCHYYPSGNIYRPGEVMYRYGWPCTRCELLDGNLCFQSLCMEKRICDNYKLDCQCRLSCKNCAKPNAKTCRCETCKPGWDWEDCSYPCMDSMNEIQPGYCHNIKSIKSSCKKPSLQKSCRKTCHICSAIDLIHAEKMCCRGKSCPPYYILNRDCECVLNCPSPLCMYPPSTTTKYPLVLQTEAAKKIKLQVTKAIKHEATKRIKATVITRNETEFSTEFLDEFNITGIAPRKDISLTSFASSSVMALYLFVVPFSLTIAHMLANLYAL